MGILSGMLLAAGIAFFGKKKLAQKQASHDTKKSSITPVANETAHTTEINKKNDSSSIIHRIRTWISKILRKK